MIEPVREHFRTNPEAKALLEKVKSYQATAAAPVETTSTSPAAASSSP